MSEYEFGDVCICKTCNKPITFVRTKWEHNAPTVEHFAQPKRNSKIVDIAKNIIKDDEDCEKGIYAIYRCGCNSKTKEKMADIPRKCAEHRKAVLDYHNV